MDCLLLGTLILLFITVAHASTLELLVVTVATEACDGYKRFIQSAEKHGFQHKTFGMGVTWQGGDTERFAGGGHKINILKDGLTEYKDREDLLIMYSDSYDVVFANGPSDILRKFEKFNARVVFSAETFCWPDVNLEHRYPVVKKTEKRFLNSGGFIGYAKDIYDILNHTPVENSDDDQLYYTTIFLDQALKSQWKMKLDTKSEIFICLNGALDETVLKSSKDGSYLFNVKTNSKPSVIHGNGPIKVEFNRLANYVLEDWTPTAGCQTCKTNLRSLDNIKEDAMPSIGLSIFIERNTPFLKEFFWYIGNLSYPKQRMDVFIHNAIPFHIVHVEAFVAANIKSYRSVKVIEPEQHVTEWNARNKAIETCFKKDCDYYFAIDSLTHLESQDIIRALIEQNKPILAPLVRRPKKLWSNFWGSVNKDGFYARSEDYIDIVQGNKVGVWNVPHISDVYMIHGSLLGDLKKIYINGMMDADMAFSTNVRDKGLFLHVTNREYFGYLIHCEDDFDITKPHPEIFELFNNPEAWENRYLHPDYEAALDPGFKNEMPCADVYWFPVFTPEFCWDFIDTLERFGNWSSGGHEDVRISGGYENVPTVDIHMNQIGFERHWLHILAKYYQPLQQKVFIGYYHDPPHAIMNFAVRYKPTEQSFLKPHHDASTYTINLALNRPHIDYEGGGSNFIRQNCSMVESRQGWSLMHPGRLTHFHEGLLVTEGTRYIMVSFVDP